MKPDYYAKAAAERLLKDEPDWPDTPEDLAAEALKRMALYRRAALNELDKAQAHVHHYGIGDGPLPRGGRSRIREVKSMANQVKDYLDTLVYWDGVYLAATELVTQGYDPDDPTGRIWDGPDDHGKGV